MNTIEGLRYLQPVELHAETNSNKPFRVTLFTDEISNSKAITVARV